MLRGPGGGAFLHGAWLRLLICPHPAATPGRAARRPCGSGSRWCPWPPCGSPACCGSTCPGNGSTSSTPSLSRGPSPTIPSSAPTEVRSPSLRWAAGRVGLGAGGPSPALHPVPSSAGIPPNKYHYIDDLVVILPQNVWEHLYNRYRWPRPASAVQAGHSAGRERGPARACLRDPTPRSLRQQGSTQAVVGHPWQPCLYRKRCPPLRASSRTLPVTGHGKLVKPKRGIGPLADSRGAAGRRAAGPVSPQPRAWLRGPGACAAWGLPGSSPSRPRVCDSVVEGRAPGRARVTLDPGGRLCHGRGGGQTGGEGEAGETRWTGFASPTHSSGTARALRLVGGSEPHREWHPQVLWGDPAPPQKDVQPPFDAVLRVRPGGLWPPWLLPSGQERK